MKPLMLYQKAFWVMVFFLVGVIIASAFPPGSARLLVLGADGLLILCIALLGRYQLALCACAALVGSLYYQLRVPIEPGSFSSATVRYVGVVQKVKQYEDRQTLTVAVREPDSFVVQMNAQRYPTYQYGDEIVATGSLVPFERNDSRWLRDRIVGQIRFPALERMGENGGNVVMRVLFRLRDAIAEQFAAALPPEQATFMTGLTLGKSAAFSDTLQDQMKITGTTHLVALSGTNVTIIVKGVLFLFGFWFSRRALFPLTVLAITLFVLMTGAEASVVRAAIMAGIVLLAERTGRVHVTYSAIVAAAFLMVMMNPSVLLFDIGFQLSFCALLGIVYLYPILMYWFGIETIESIVLRAACSLALMTLAAQLAVFPLSLLHFGFASIISILPNVLIALFIPITMFFGFMIALAGALSDYLGLFVALPARLLLGYELGVIHFFSRFEVGISTESFPLTLVFAYYLVLIGFMAWSHYRKGAMIE